MGMDVLFLLSIVGHVSGPCFHLGHVHRYGDAKRSPLAHTTTTRCRQEGHLDSTQYITFFNFWSTHVTNTTHLTMKFYACS